MIKKILFAILIFFSVCLKSFAYENIISSLIINDSDELEIEVLMDKGQMYLPCKYFLKYFDIPYKENHAQKNLTYKDVIVKQGSILINNEKQKSTAFFLKQGITDVQNEFFVPAEILSKTFDKDIVSDTNQLVVFYKTKDYGQVIEKKNENPFLIKDGTIKATAYDEIVLPQQKGFFSLDSIGYKNNMVSDSYSQIYKDSSSKNFAFNNNMQLTLKGKLNKGDYKVDFGTNSYTQNMFAFSGISPQYKNQFKGFDYLLGKTDSWNFAGDDISTDLMGVQLKDHVYEKLTYQDIDGYVNPTSTVKVYINNDFDQELSTYGGYYSLKNLYYGKDIKKIKINELLADGSEKEVLCKEFKTSTSNNVPRRDFLLGITGMQNRIWANNGSLYQMNTKKWTAGFKQNKQISDKLRFENFIIADKMLNNQNTNWGQSILGNRKYLNYTTMKNMNALEGQTYMGAITYNNNEKMDSKLIFGGSNSKAIDGITEDGLGFLLKYENNYQLNKDTTLKGSAFAISPSFYMAGSTYGGSISDRVGGSIGGQTTYQNLFLSGNYSKYKSNFANYYSGGLIDFDEYNLLARATFKKAPSVSLKINNKKGANDLGEISSSSYELSADKRFRKLTLRGGYRKSVYSNQYNSSDYSGYTSEFSNIYTDVDFPLGKRFGNVSLGHEIVEAKSDSTTNDYNSIKVAYTTPSVKGFNCNVSTGFHYAGTTKGNDFGFGITKRLKSGSAVSLNYRYSAVPCYVIDNMYIPGSMRHSITVDFAELYGIEGFGLKGIGTGNEDKGTLQITAFLDINQNGIRDKNEPLIENVPIKIDNKSEIIMLKKKAKENIIVEENGVHEVKIFEDEMPTLLICSNKTKPVRHVKINNNAKAKIEFGLLSSVGNINGSVTIKDEFNNVLKFDDVIVSVLSTDGREVNYTNINDDSTFSFSGLSPGKYVVAIDKELQNLYKIKPDTKSENYFVEIPPEYKNYVNIDNVNLDYKYEI